MGLQKILARDLIVEVQDDDGLTWLEVAGLTTITPNPGENEEKANTTTNDDNGAYSERVVQRGATLSLEGLKLKDKDTGAGDPGQDRIEALGAFVGEESVGKVRFRHPMDAVWKQWNATVSLGEQGGGTNDMTGWKATLTRDGNSTTVAVTP